MERSKIVANKSNNKHNKQSYGER